MMKRIKNLLYILLSSLIVSGCQNLADELNGSENAGGNSKYATVTFSVGEQPDGARATAYPTYLALNDYTCFELSGENSTIAGDTVTCSYTFNSYTELRNASLRLATGTWTFTLKAQKESGSGLLDVATGTQTAVLSAGSSFSVLFSLQYAATGYGPFNYTIKLPSGAVDSVKVNISATLGSGSTETINASDFAVASNIMSVTKTNNLPDGNYFVRLEFLKGGSVIATKIEYAKIIPNLTTTAVYSYNANEINKPYSITYIDSDGTAFTDFVATGYKNSFNGNEDVELPGAAAINTADYAFEGWYEDAALTKKVGTGWIHGAETDGQGWQHGKKAADVTLYAKRTFTVNVLDRGRTTYSGTEHAQFTVIKGHEYTLPTTLQSSLSGEGIKFSVYFDASNGVVTFLRGNKEDDPSVIYAFWTANYVYIDPAAGSDNNSGFSADSPVKTVAEAKLLLNANGVLSGKRLYAISPINVSSEINGLNNLTSTLLGTAELYSYNGNGLIDMSSGYVSVNNLTIDGGANPNAAVLIELSGGTLTLGSNVVIKGAESNDKNRKTGGAIHVNGGELNATGGLTITKCRARLGGGIYITSGTCNLTGTLIKECSAIYGGAIYINNPGTCTLTDCELTGNIGETGSPAMEIHTNAFATFAGTTYADTAISLQTGAYVKVASDYTGTESKVTTLTSVNYDADNVKLLGFANQADYDAKVSKFKVEDSPEGIRYKIAGMTDGSAYSGYLASADEGAGITPDVPSITEYALGTLKDGTIYTRDGTGNITVTIQLNPEIIQAGKEILDTANLPRLEWVNSSNPAGQGDAGGSIIDGKLQYNFAMASGIFAITIGDIKTTSANAVIKPFVETIYVIEN